MPTSPLLAEADRAALAADRRIAGLWRELLAVLRTTQGFAHDYRRALAVLRRLPAEAVASLRDGLAGLYHLGYRKGAHAAGGRVEVRESRLTEDEAPPGTLSLPRLLFPPPDESWVQGVLSRLVRPSDWLHVGDDDRKLPEDLAHLFASLVGQGKSQQQVAKELRPYFEGSRVRARRFARTFGIAVAHQGQMEAWGHLGPLVVGYQVHSAKAPTSRSWHVSRSGTIYWKQPGPGQKGLYQMPRPPFEADDPAERPPGAPKIAWNCLCFLTPIFRE